MDYVRDGFNSFQVLTVCNLRTWAHYTIRAAFTDSITFLEPLTREVSQDIRQRAFFTIFEEAQEATTPNRIKSS